MHKHVTQVFATQTNSSRVNTFITLNSEGKEVHTLTLLKECAISLNLEGAIVQTYILHLVITTTSKETSKNTVLLYVVYWTANIKVLYN